MNVIIRKWRRSVLAEQAAREHGCGGSAGNTCEIVAYVRGFAGKDFGVTTDLSVVVSKCVHGIHASAAELGSGKPVAIGDAEVWWKLANGDPRWDRWPLDSKPALPPLDGSFGAVRRFDHHTGVDLHSTHGAPFYAVESGDVVAEGLFTGIESGSPWWRTTSFLMVEGRSGVICYGEVSPDRRESNRIQSGQRLGVVIPVLWKSKPFPSTPGQLAERMRPVAMLHLEIYKPGTREPLVWPLSTVKPEQLGDPTAYLQELIIASGRS